MALLEGGHYGLVSHRDYGTGKSLCVYVKITDSSQKAIEDYIASKAASRTKPTIRLVDQDVVLKIPDPHGSVKAFTLHLQELSADSYDCIRQKDKSELELLDTMAHKLTVRATDDVYQTTKEKVAIVDEENKKNCAKEIKPGGKGLGKKIKKVVRNGGGIITRTVQPPSSAAIKVASRSTVSPSRSRTSPPATRFPAENRPTGAAAKSATGSSGNGHSARRQATATSAAASPLNSLPAANKPKNTELLALPLRQRVIHVLALQPYTKAELKVKLNADGLSPSDHGELNGLVNSVATVNRAKQLVLLSGCYKEVDVNWKFYSDANKQLVRRRLATMLEGGSKPGHGAPAPGGAPAPTTNVENLLKRSPSSLDHFNSSGGNKRPRLSTVQPTAQRHPEGKSQAVKPADSFIADDYVSRYTRLTEPEQREKYKEDFNQEYEEYLRLHKALEKVSRKFAGLADRLNQAADGSPEHSAIEKEIRREYRLVKADSRYNEQKRRMEYLHGKLSHIKELVVDYDSRMAFTSEAGGGGGGS